MSASDVTWCAKGRERVTVASLKRLSCAKGRERVTVASLKRLSLLKLLKLRAGQIIAMHSSPTVSMAV